MIRPAFDVLRRRRTFVIFCDHASNHIPIWDCRPLTLLVTSRGTQRRLA